MLADVSEHNSNPAGENELRFVVGTCVSFTCIIRDSGVLPSELHRGKNVDRWMLIAGFSDEMWMLQ